MAFVFRGNTSSSIYGLGMALPVQIDNFSLANKTGGSIGVNVYVIDGTNPAISVAVTPTPVTLATGEMYYEDRTIYLNQNDRVRIAASGSCDYYFNCNNQEIPLSE